jgi:hypothetical protein
MPERRSAGVLTTRCFRLLLVLAFFLPLLVIAQPVAASAPTNEHFRRTWARTDEPVARGVVQRTWMWGPGPATGDLPELYREAPGGQRVVQYFDKSRMEITHPDGNPDDTWYVTNGLLVVELVSGRMQFGDDAFVTLTPAAVNVAGDPDDPHGPTYATLNLLLDQEPAAVGSVITQRLDRSGSVTNDPALQGRQATVATIDEVTQHAIAAPFWTFMNSGGLVLEGGESAQAALFVDPLYATGRPITEPYWTTVRVGGTPLDVLLQCFERRCLTWTPDNPAGWQVEAGNVGQHYYHWRYEVDHGAATHVIRADEGASVQAGDAVLIEVPAGALSDDAILSIVPALTAPTHPALRPVSDAVQVELSGARQVGPVLLSLGWDRARLPAGVPASRLTVAYWDDVQNESLGLPANIEARVWYGGLAKYV